MGFLATINKSSNKRKEQLDNTKVVILIKRKISSETLLFEYFKESDEFDITLFLNFIDNNCDIYLIGDFYRKGNKILNKLNIKTKEILSNEELCNSKNCSLILIETDESKKHIK